MNTRPGMSWGTNTWSLHIRWEKLLCLENASEGAHPNAEEDTATFLVGITDLILVVDEVTQYLRTVLVLDLGSEHL